MHLDRSPIETDPPISPERAMLKATLMRAELSKNGFELQGTGTRREIFETLMNPQAPFAKGYRPTWFEVNDEAYGRDNWATVFTGNIISDPSLSSDAEASNNYQNRELEVFVRDPELAQHQALPTAFDIEQAIDAHLR